MARRKSGIDRAKRLDLVERARRMTPTERLAACVNLSQVTAQLHLAGRRHRRGRAELPKPRS